MKQFCLYTSLFTLLFLSNIFAITGTVTTRDGAPIPAVSILLSESGKSFTTGDDGRFSTLVTEIATDQSTVSHYVVLNKHSIILSGMKSREEISLSIYNLQGRTVSQKSFISSESGLLKASLQTQTEQLANGIYILSIRGESINYQMKSVISSQMFQPTQMKINSFTPEMNHRSSRASVETITFSHDDYQETTIESPATNEDITIVLDPYGPDGIPILLPPVDGKLIIDNGSKRLKVRSVMPGSGVQDWSESVEGRYPTGVNYDTTLTSATTMKAQIIRDGMENDWDWQISFATATIGEQPFDELSHILIRYKVESEEDTIAFSLNESHGDSVIGEYDNRGAYRAVLKRGAQNPGEFVTDTLTLDDFTISWSMDEWQVGNSIADNMEELGKLSAFAFSNEFNPWDEQNGHALNDGDTIHMVLAGILFGAEDTLSDTLIDSTEYPVHRNIIASTFWVGEGASDDNDFITNTMSAWDSKWGTKFGIEDAPLIDRNSDFIPTSSKYKGTENPFYCALPYNDMGRGVYDGSGPEDNSAPIDGYSRKVNSYEVVHWADEMSKSEWGYRNSMCKNRWVKIQVSGTDKVCYVQWEDAGPYYYNDHEYVFGTDRPANTTDSPFAAIDLSPSACLYLGRAMKEWGSPSFEVDWNFVDEEDVPDGPWKLHVTTGQIDW